MTDSQKSLAFLSGAWILIGTIAITTSILYSVFAGFAFWPFFFSVLAGLMVGLPAIAVGSRLEPSQASDRRFWPSRESTIQFCRGILSVAAIVSVPAALLPTFWLIPAGDSWPLVIARFSLLTLFLAATYWWAKTCGLEKRFRGRASEEAVNYSSNPSTSVQKSPASPVSTFWECCGILLIATIAFSIVFGFVDFNDKWWQVDVKSSRRYRFLAELFMWCRGNPNSTWSTSLMIGLGAVGLFAYQITDLWRGLRRKKSESAGRQQDISTGEPHMSRSKLVEVGRFESEAHAAAAAVWLREAGIESMIEGASVTNALSYVGVASVKLLISEAHLLQANELLLEYEESNQLAPSAPWLCDECNEMNEGSFDLCWKCQSERSTTATELSPNQVSQNDRQATECMIDQQSPPADQVLGAAHVEDIIRRAFTSAVLGIGFSLIMTPYSVLLLIDSYDSKLAISQHARTRRRQAWCINLMVMSGWLAAFIYYRS
jgi:hypothetical protein